MLQVEAYDLSEGREGAHHKEAVKACNLYTLTNAEKEVCKCA